MNKNLLSFSSVKLASKKAYEMAKITPSQIDFAEIHDGFTVAQITGMEDIGLCKPGEAHRLIMKGETKTNGRLPINPSGGLISNGHAVGASGLTQIYEIIKQLRGEAEKNQVRGKIGLANNIGGFVGSCSINIFKGTR